MCGTLRCYSYSDFCGTWLKFPEEGQYMQSALWLAHCHLLTKWAHLYSLQIKPSTFKLIWILKALLWYLQQCTALSSCQTCVPGLYLGEAAVGAGSREEQALGSSCVLGWALQPHWQFRGNKNVFKSLSSRIAPQEVVSGSPSQKCFAEHNCRLPWEQPNCWLHFCHLQSRPLENEKCHLDIKFNDEAHHCVSMTFEIST